MSLIFAIFAFGLLIAFHEFGHMWVARRMGMRVDRFSIGFGPTIFSWRRGETEFVLSAIPLGGYVKIAGMSTEDDDVAADDPRSYANKPAWRRLLVIAAGPFANYLLAFLIGVPLLMVGLKKADTSMTRIGDVGPDSPAAIAGVRAGDVVRAVDGIAVSAWEPMKQALAKAATAKPNAAFPLEVERAGEKLTLQITPKVEGRGFIIGVEPATVDEPGLALPAAIVQAGENLWLQTAGTVELLAKALTTGGVKFSGPIGILSHTSEQAKKGLIDFIQTVWLLSVAIGFFNILPIPALDGGRIMFLLFEVISRRRMNQRVEGWIHTAGMVGLLGLIVVVSVGDAQPFVSRIMKSFGGG